MTPETVTELRAAGLDPDDTERVVAAALDEDFRYGPDITSEATVGDRQITVEVVAREPGVLAGLPVARAVLDGGSIIALRADGDRIAAGEAVLRMTGSATFVLGAERTVLNFLTHLSGIATTTRAWADAVAGTGAIIRDTRKTLPGLRALQKYAVRCGGGSNHRMALGDAALIKDNHVAAAGGVSAAIAAVRGAWGYGQPLPGGHGANQGGEASPRGHGGGVSPRSQGGSRGDRPPLEIECDTLAQVRESLAAGARLILLDNMDVSTMRAAVRIARGFDGVRLEASGGLRLENAREVASTGVDYLAVGALTHSSRALDLGVDITM